MADERGGRGGEDGAGDGTDGLGRAGSPGDADGGGAAGEGGDAGGADDAGPLPEPSEAVGDGRQKYIEVETADGERHEHGDSYLRQSEWVIFVSSEAGFPEDDTVTYPKHELARVTVEQHHSSCFITTAVAGEEPTLAALRGFRDEALSPSRVGRPLVGVYEAVSPPIADTLAARPDGVTARTVRWLVRRCADLAERRETAGAPARAGLSVLLVALYVVGLAVATAGHLAATVGAVVTPD